MKHLFSKWREVENCLEGRHLFLCLDYDGTLTRIVRNPDCANLSRPNLRTLRALSKANEIKTAIISGRSLSDLKSRVRIKNLIYGGNHGLEFEGPQIRFVHSQAQRLTKRLAHVGNKIERALKSYRGVAVENKGLSLSVHYRKLNPKHTHEAELIFESVIFPYLRTGDITTTDGKKVWEIRPPVKWNKGTAVLWLRGRLEGRLGRAVYPIYMGDDRTDEDAFRAIKRKGLGIKIASDLNTRSAATYYLNSIREVYLFLNRLIRIRDGSPQLSMQLRVAREPSL